MLHGFGIHGKGLKGRVGNTMRVCVPVKKRLNIGNALKNKIKKRRYIFII